MTDWLKAWGLPSEPLQDDWKNQMDGFFTRRATYPRHPSVRPGDRLFYYAVGHRVVFGVYEVTSLPFPSGEDGRFDWHVKVEPIVDLEFLHDGIPVEKLNVDGRDLKVSMRQKSAIKLRPGEVQIGEEELRRRAETRGANGDG